MTGLLMKRRNRGLVLKVLKKHASFGNYAEYR